MKECTCSIAMVKAYQKKISGPLMDRSAQPPLWGLTSMLKYLVCPLKSSAASPYGRRTQCESAGTDRGGSYHSARAFQRHNAPNQRRYGAGRNSQILPDRRNQRQYPKGRLYTLLKAAMQQMQLSARAYHRILKLAQTIADLAGSEQIQTAHIVEAIQYRPRLR